MLMLVGDSIQVMIRGHNVADFDCGEAWVGYSSTRCSVIEQCCVARASPVMRRKLLRYERLRKLVVLLLVVQLCSVPTWLLLVLPMGRQATHIVVIWHDQLLVTSRILVLEKELLLLSEGRSTVFVAPVLRICRHASS